MTTDTSQSMAFMARALNQTNQHKSPNNYKSSNKDRTFCTHCKFKFSHQRSKVMIQFTCNHALIHDMQQMGMIVKADKFQELHVLDDSQRLKTDVKNANLSTTAYNLGLCDAYTLGLCEVVALANTPPQGGECISNIPNLLREHSNTLPHTALVIMSAS
ncbi:hypothetical protein LXL04_024951 [Taraxacum kok-saghyz]